MRKSILKLSIVLTGACIIVALGCQTSALKSNPGALPKATAGGPPPRLEASTYFAHGNLLERQGDFHGAVEQYERALQSSPNFPAARNRLGITLNKMHRNVEATQQFRVALTQRPNDAQLLNNLGFSLFLCGDYAGAEHAFRRTIEVAPTFTRAHMNLALVLGKQNDLDAALQEFLSVCNEADAYYNISVLQADVGRLTEAAASLEHCLELNPKLEVAREQLREVSKLAAIEEAKHAANATAAAIKHSPAISATPTTTETSATNSPRVSETDAALASSSAEPARADLAPAGDPACNDATIVTVQDLTALLTGDCNDSAAAGAGTNDARGATREENDEAELAAFITAAAGLKGRGGPVALSVKDFMNKAHDSTAAGEFDLNAEAACISQRAATDVLKLCRLAIEASLAGYAGLRDSAMYQLTVQIERETGGARRTGR